jgi:hypothetical protein
MRPAYPAGGCFTEGSSRRLPTWTKFDTGWPRAIDGDHGCLLQHDCHPACGCPLLVFLQVLIEASPRAVVGVHATDEHPVAAPEQIGYFFERAPRQACRPLLDAEQKDQGVCRVARNGELPAPGGSCQRHRRRHGLADGVLDFACHAASMAQFRMDVDARSSRGGLQRALCQVVEALHQLEVAVSADMVNVPQARVADLWPHGVSAEPAAAGRIRSAG